MAQRGLARLSEPQDTASYTYLVAQRVGDHAFVQSDEKNHHRTRAKRAKAESCWPGRQQTAESRLVTALCNIYNNF